MMSRSSDLVPAFDSNTDKGLGFRQGVVIAWDPDTAENTVLVGGSLMTNLPILNTSEASILAAGDVVGVLTGGATWAIMGRYTVPGSPEAVTSIQAITNRIKAAEDISNGTRNSTVYGDLTGTSVGPAVTIRIGTSGRALVLWGAELGQIDTSSNFLQFEYRITPHVGIQVSGANTIAASDWNALNFNLEHPAPASTGAATTQFWAQVSTMHLFTGLSPGITTFTMKYRHDNILPTSNGARSNFQAREIAVFAL
jgi:hypothetical protein